MSPLMSRSHAHMTHSSPQRMPVSKRTDTMSCTVGGQVGQGIVDDSGRDGLDGFGFPCGGPSAAQTGHGCQGVIDVGGDQLDG